MEAQGHLAFQNIDIDPASLHALTPEIISRQATINIGTIGHVAHGKSTLVRAISGVNVTISFPLKFQYIARPSLQGTYS